MDARLRLSRRRFLQTLAATSGIAAADLAWWKEPLITPRRAWGAARVRFQSACPSALHRVVISTIPVAVLFSFRQRHPIRGL